MQLKSFKVQKYRSIGKTQKMPLGNLTVLVGPNNEGKSNILRALAVGLRMLGQFSNDSTLRGRPKTQIRYRSRDYQWDRDFPKHLQQKQPDGNTVLDFEFQLTAAELDDFAKVVAVKLKTSLPIRLAIGPRTMELTVRKQGPGGAALTAKRSKVAQFVARNIRVEHVPSVRTATSAMDVVAEMVEEELWRLSTEPAYQAALTGIEKAQEPVLTGLAQVLLGTLRDFLPEVRSVQVAIPRGTLEAALREGATIIVDDGTPTDIRFKGDGVQSLAALALLREAAQTGSRARELVLAIEEPEAHLHPAAIRRLKQVLVEIATLQQVVVTTHSPLLVNRAETSSNIIVASNRAVPAKSVGELRRVLGVRTSDNLESAEVVLVVEGECDVTSLAALLPGVSPRLKAALVGGVLALEPLRGVTNLEARLQQLRDSLCVAHVFVDYDEAARKAISRAHTEGLLKPLDEHLTTVPGMKESELEDLLDPSLYSGALKAFGLDVEDSAFRNGKKKFSDRMGDLAKKSGKDWNDSLKRDIKVTIAERVAQDPGMALHPQRRSAFDAMATELERKLLGHGEP